MNKVGHSLHLSKSGLGMVAQGRWRLLKKMRPLKLTLEPVF